MVHAVGIAWLLAGLTPAAPVVGWARLTPRAPDTLTSAVPPPPIIRRVDVDGMSIAITFDACATKSHGYGFDRPVYRVLQRQNVPATIFVSGRWVEFHPRAMKDLAADPLIEFGNHSYGHRHMAKLPDEKIASEIDKTEAALAIHGKRSVAFRPPFGKFSDRVLRIAHDKHLPVVLWDVVSGDPSASATAHAIVRTVMRKARAGSIVIFHINGRETQTATALPKILNQLREGGFQFVHISTLLAAGGTAVAGARVGTEAILPLAPVDSAGPSPRPCGARDGAVCP